MIKRLRHKDTAIEFDAFFPAVLRVCNPQRNMPPPVGARRLFGVFRSPLQGFFGCGPYPGRHALRALALGYLRSRFQR